MLKHWMGLSLGYKLYEIHSDLQRYCTDTLSQLQAAKHVYAQNAQPSAHAQNVQILSKLWTGLHAGARILFWGHVFQLCNQRGSDGDIRDCF